MTTSSDPRVLGPLYRQIAIDVYGPLPVKCRCGEMINKISRYDGSVHHLDENPWNNDPTNLEIIHNACHAKLHHTGRVHSEETKAKLRKPKSLDTRRKMSEAQRGHEVEQSQRANISKTLQGRLVGAATMTASCSCGKTGSRGPIAYHAKRLGHEWIRT